MSKDKCKETILKDLINEDIFQTSQSNNDNLIFEQYKIYVEMANDVSNRRESTNKFYITLVAALFGLISYLFKPSYNNFVFVLLIVIFFVSLIWYKHILEYKKLNAGKFGVINYLENYLPAKGYTTEWDLVQLEDYKGLTNWDKNIALVIGILSIVLVFIFFIQKFFCFF